MKRSWKRPWCWERLKAGRKGDNRGWDGWMASPTQWTWVWASSGCWWWRRKPGVWQSMGLQRVGHDWVTELNWRRPLNVRPQGWGAKYMTPYLTPKEGSLVMWSPISSSVAPARDEGFYLLAASPFLPDFLSIFLYNLGCIALFCQSPVCFQWELLNM